jgi:hypothetical protein
MLCCSPGSSPSPAADAAVAAAAKPAAAAAGRGYSTWREGLVSAAEGFGPTAAGMEWRGSELRGQAGR